MLLQKPNGQQKWSNYIIHLCPPLFHMHYRLTEHALDFHNCICIADGKKLELQEKKIEKKVHHNNKITTF